MPETWWIWLFWLFCGALGEGREGERKESREVYTEGLLCQICSYGAFIPIGKTVFKFSRFVFLYLKTIISFAPFYPFLFILGYSVASRLVLTLEAGLQGGIFDLPGILVHSGMHRCSPQTPHCIQWLYIFLIVFSFLMTACCCLFKIQKAIDCILSRFDFGHSEISTEYFWVIKHAFIVGTFWNSVFPFLRVALLATKMCKTHLQLGMVRRRGSL